MGYLRIPNLYADDSILYLFKEVYASEKIHGTSAHCTWKKGRLSFFSGGAKHTTFVSLFNQEDLAERFAALGHDEETSIEVYGEAYGGKMQGMSQTYGPSLRFVAFDVKIGGCWLSTPKAEEVVKSLGLEFIHYVRIPTTLEAVDGERDAESVQAIRNGVGPGKMREGVVLRPLEEMTRNNGKRIIAKHKRDEFRESASPQPKPGQNKEATTKIKAYVAEYVVNMRLQHVLDKINPPVTDMTRAKEVINAMYADLIREEPPSKAMDTRVLFKHIAHQTVLLLKQHLYRRLKPEHMSEGES